jgi:anti-sigma factor RsiW
MHNERLAGGLRCSEVLALLSDFVEGDLPPERIAQIQDHVAVCDNCRRFGASFQQLLSVIAQQALPPEPPAAVLERLTRRIDETFPER